MIYLHFLDRELRESVNAELSYEYIKEIVLTGVFMNNEMRMSYSHYFETCLYDNELAKIIIKLNSLKLLRCYTSHSNFAEFIKSHRDMYAHDEARYPFYFDDSLSDPKLIIERHKSSTTEELFQKMLVNKVLNDEYDESLKNEFRKYLGEIGKKAITKAAFRPFLDKLPEPDQKRLSKKINIFISENYTKRYVGENDYIITGINALEHYERLTPQQFLFNFQIYRTLLDFLLPTNFAIDSIEKLVIENRLMNIKEKLFVLVKGLVEIALITSNANEPFNANKIINFLKMLIRGINLNSEFTLEQKIFSLQSTIDYKINSIRNKKCDYLLLCATNEELNAILNYPLDWVLIENGYFTRTKDKDIVLFQTGAGMVSASIIGQKLISLYNPSVIVMIGFCAGSSKDVKLGDIIIADKIYNYSTGKQLSDEVLNELECFTISTSIARKLSIRNYEYSNHITMPKDYELQLWQFLKRLQPLREPKIEKVYDIESFPDWDEILKECQEKKYITILKDCVSISESGEEYINNIKIKYPTGLTQYTPTIRSGVMACGCYVQQQEEIFTKLKIRERKTIALDMESFAIAKLANENNIDFFVIKGVGDFANDHKAFANRFIEFSTSNALHIALQVVDMLN